MEKEKTEEVKKEAQPVQKQEMTKEQAFNMVKQVCNVYKGSLEEHVLLQQALKVLQ